MGSNDWPNWKNGKLLKLGGKWKQGYKAWDEATRLHNEWLQHHPVARVSRSRVNMSEANVQRVEVLGNFARKAFK